MQSPAPTFHLLTFRRSGKHRLHERAPVSTRRSFQAALKRSPLTDIGNGVGANTSPLTVVANPSGHIAISLHFLSTSSSLIQEYSCRFSICVISRFISSLDFVGLREVSPSMCPAKFSTSIMVVGLNRFGSRVCELELGSSGRVS